MNIRSPNRGGESIHFLNILDTTFDITVLTEIGSRNLSTAPGGRLRFSYYAAIR